MILSWIASLTDENSSKNEQKKNFELPIRKGQCIYAKCHLKRKVFWRYVAIS